MTPCIGASGGISGLLAYYALRFPKMRLGMLFYWRWIQFPAWGAFVLWILTAILWRCYRNITASVDVAALAHLGGVIPGIVFWWLWQKRLTSLPANDPIRNLHSS